jgi:uncharacterized protein (DUF2235 family)
MSDTGLGITATVPRRLGVFLDGTWNTVKSDTNVWRLKELCAPVGTDGVPQSTHYSPGVGTKIGEELIGGIFGYGLNDEIIAAYQWLIDNYNSGDELFLFGFSRGAFTARSLAGLISRCGLPLHGSPASANAMFARYRLGDNVRTIRGLLEDQSNGAGTFSDQERLMLQFCIPTPIKFIGVWDTVGALGVPDVPWIKWGSEPFLDTNLRVSETFAFHAVAVDEHRDAFSPTLWTKYVPKDPSAPSAPSRPLSQVEQRWFVGAHANVGGGYVGDVLHELPLKWMAEKAALHGLAFSAPVATSGNLDAAPVADSYAEFLYGAYKLVTAPLFREIDRSPEERSTTVVHTINETIDASVFERWRNNRLYRPQNLVAWATKHRVDPKEINSSIRADDPAIEITSA